MTSERKMRDVSQVWVAHGGRCLGRLVLRDQPRSEAREALAAMRALGIDRLVLLTGDRAAVAARLGEVLGMDEVVAEVLPAQKLEVVRAEQSAGRTVMMVGDGVNDAPALGGADVGVAIGAELNEVALGGADVALLGTDLGRLPQLIGLADITRRVIGQNVWLAFGLSVVLIALAARGVLDPLTGALAQSVAVLAVVANSARILRFTGSRSAETATVVPSEAQVGRVCVRRRSEACRHHSSGLRKDAMIRPGHDPLIPTCSPLARHGSPPKTERFRTARSAR